MKNEGIKAFLKRIIPIRIQQMLMRTILTSKHFAENFGTSTLNVSYLAVASLVPIKNPFLHISKQPVQLYFAGKGIANRPWRKVIIWGHKDFSNTFYHIDFGYYRAFQALGFETYFFDDREADKLQGFNFENCLFFAEGEKEKNIPLVKSSAYIFHYVDPKKYEAHGIRFINFANYMKLCDQGISPHHKENRVEKIADCTFWDDRSNTLYQPWATDLLPHEIDSDDIVVYNPRKKNINYIGAMYPHNRDQFMPFAAAAAIHGKHFKTGKNFSEARSYHLVRNSYISVDLRGPWHIECGYIPCRIYKNISYGKFTGVNSENVGKILGDYVAYDPDSARLFDITETAYKNLNREKMKEAMDYVKANHTYINRAQNLLKFV